MNTSDEVETHLDTAHSLRTILFLQLFLDIVVHHFVDYYKFVFEFEYQHHMMLYTEKSPSILTMCHQQDSQ
jgi:hypothetical protein